MSLFDKYKKTADKTINATFGNRSPYLEHMELLESADEFEQLFYHLKEHASKQSDFETVKMAWEKAGKLLLPLIRDVKS